jgi:hypothetical protein
MEAIEAVLALVKERDELAADLDTYESWFESLVGKEVTVTVKSKKKTRFIDCVVDEFLDGEGWGMTSDDGESFQVTFEDFAAGKVWVRTPTK